MDDEIALDALAALAQATRLKAFRTLVRHEPNGLKAGELAAVLGVPQNTLSAHLAILARAGLVSADRRSRNIVYRAGLGRFRGLMLFLITDCCAGNSDLCEPLFAALPRCG